MKKSKTNLFGNMNVSLYDSEDKAEIVLEVESRVIPIVINKHSTMHQWNHAFAPLLTRSSERKVFWLNNLVEIELGVDNNGSLINTWRNILDPSNTYQMSTKDFIGIINAMYIPECYEHEILQPLGVTKKQDIVLQTVIQNWNKIPETIDASKWRVHKILDSILYEKTYQYCSGFLKVPLLRFGTGFTDFWIQTELDDFYRKHREYVDTEVMEAKVNRKVKLPLQAPNKIKNFQAYALTATPQSEHAGRIAELAIGTQVNEIGYITHVPKVALSLATSMNPFPQRISPLREVVQQSLTQALYLENPDEPLVYFDGVIE